jgi:hypothetical protein
MRMERPFRSRTGIVIGAALIGLVAAALEVLGNPPNMGVCVVCFERDLAGALGLHRAAPVQYLGAAGEAGGAGLHQRRRDHKEGTDGIS